MVLSKKKKKKRGNEFEFIQTGIINTGIWWEKRKINVQCELRITVSNVFDRLGTKELIF